MFNLNKVQGKFEVMLNKALHTNGDIQSLTKILQLIFLALLLVVVFLMMIFVLLANSMVH